MSRSAAFDLALAEVVRVWDAADHLDTKILQFTSVITAGTIAGASLFFGRSDFIQQRWFSVPGLLAASCFLCGLSAFIGFFALMLRSTIGTQFAGPLDPRRLAKRPEVLTDDGAFEKEMLPLVAEAFDLSTKGTARKIDLFRRGISFLACSLGVSLLGFVFFVWLSSK